MSAGKSQNNFDGNPDGNPGNPDGNHGKQIQDNSSDSENGDIIAKASPSKEISNDDHSEAPPLPEEQVPPLPLEIPPSNRDPQDDGWDPIWDDNAQAYYFYNRFTGSSQWANPRVPESQPALNPGVGPYDRINDAGTAPATTAPATTAPTTTSDSPPARPYGGYDPAIHGDYDPTAPYAQETSQTNGSDDGAVIAAMAATDSDSGAIYTATGMFNRFTGKWQPNGVGPENHNDENKSKRQMSAFFDVDAAANSHNGKSLKAERSGKKLSKQELKAFKEKRKEKKEEKRRAWLRD